MTTHRDSSKDEEYTTDTKIEYLRKPNMDAGHLIYTMRFVHFMAVIVEMLMLYMEADRIGLSFLIIAVLHFVNLVHGFQRWQFRIDGRFDFKQMLSPSTPAYQKLHYAVAFFGNLILSFLTHMLTPRIIGSIPGAFSSLFYHIANYAAIVTSFGVVALDIFDATKTTITRH